MQLLKNIVTNWLMFLTLMFGLTISAVAENDIENIKTQAEQGNARAQSVLASRYSLGLKGVSQDYTKAFYWHKKAAGQGNVVSQYSTGYAYAKGQGVRQDYSKALYWHKKAADRNQASSQFSLGVMYEMGQGVRQDYPAAKEWYGKSCDNGLQLGCVEYRELNEQGY